MTASPFRASNMILQAITTKYIGPTDRLGTRVIARAAAGRHVHHWDHALNTDANHYAAARALADRLKWHDGYELVKGSSPDGTGYVFVLVRAS